MGRWRAGQLVRSHLPCLRRWELGLHVRVSERVGHHVRVSLNHTWWCRGKAVRQGTLLRGCLSEEGAWGRPRGPRWQWRREGCPPCKGHRGREVLLGHWPLRRKRG